MANSARNGTQRRPPSDVDSLPPDQSETAKGREAPIGESGYTLETPGVWRGASRSECWTRATATVWGSWGSPFTAPDRPALPLHRLPRRRTPLHSLRPSQEAEARFVPRSSEFLND